MHGHDPGLQRHHLLPRQLLSCRFFGRFFASVGRGNVGFDDFRRNGLLLPANEETSVRTGMPLHRGPHRHYNDLVIHRVGQIEQDWSDRHAQNPGPAMEEAITRLAWLQAALRRRLLDHRLRPLKLNRSDPLGAGYDFSELDAMAETLWQSTGSEPDQPM